MKLEILKIENEILVQQVNDLNTVVLKFTTEKKSLDLLLRKQK